MMLIHSVMIALVLYVIMLFGLNQSSVKAEHRSALIGGVAFVYMLVFGHGPPNKMNRLLQ